MKVFTFIVTAFFALLIAACCCDHPNYYEFIPPHSDTGNIGIYQCGQKHKHCDKECRLTYQSCRANAEANASLHYHNYLKNRKAQKKLAVRKYPSFLDYSECQTQCGCNADYRQCYALQGGKVLKLKPCR